MAEAQDLTPEEKLLKVIQKGEPRQEPAASVSSEDLPADEAGEMLREPLLQRGGAFRGLPLVNRLLVAAAVVLFLLSGYETWRNLPPAEPVYPSAELEMAEPEAPLVVASLGDTLDRFSRRRIFGRPMPSVQPGERADVAALSGWRAYARENLKLMGMSEIISDDETESPQRLEAIVMDIKEKKMHFLRESQILRLVEQPVVVSRIGEASVELSLGEYALTIE